MNDIENLIDYGMDCYCEIIYHDARSFRYCLLQRTSSPGAEILINTAQLDVTRQFHIEQKRGENYMLALRMRSLNASTSRLILCARLCSYFNETALTKCVAGMAEKLREAAARGDVARVARLLDEDIKPLPDEVTSSSRKSRLKIHQVYLNLADSSHDRKEVNPRAKPFSYDKQKKSGTLYQKLMVTFVKNITNNFRTQYDTDTVSSEDNDSLERAEKAIGIVSVIVQEDPAGYEIGHNASIAALTDGQSSLPSFAAEHVWLDPASKGDIGTGFLACPGRLPTSFENESKAGFTDPPDHHALQQLSEYIFVRGHLFVVNLNALSDWFTASLSLAL
ncbi:hypothetical protein WN51_01885 [Melipona quadrifasciata]|uniref:Uncharacterized protein n=1 Tax=Melipona quadrifasciata TaxID=166423 RepID=A0A0N0BF56_9HYME|nr:hypothetical protein WN51_01885 [Melipona quadrifasciata]